jgi:hypothetical protein
MSIGTCFIDFNYTARLSKTHWSNEQFRGLYERTAELQPTHIGDKVITAVEFIEKHAETGEAG